MQLCTGNQLNKDALNIVNSKTNRNTVPHCQLSLSRDAKTLLRCHCRYQRHCLRLPVLFL